MSRSRRPAKGPRVLEPGCIICDPAAYDDLGRRKMEAAEMKSVEDELLEAHIEAQMAKRPTLVLRFRDDFDKQAFITHLARGAEGIYTLLCANLNDPIIDLEMEGEDG